MKHIENSKIFKDMDIALQHEYICCNDAFLCFADAATLLIYDNDNRKLSILAYNNYSRFLHHLFEFYVGCIKRGTKSTKRIPPDTLDLLITNEVQKLLNMKRNAILNGYAPWHENDISAYPEIAPQEFAKELRTIRNNCHAHVNHNRPNLNFTAFYEKYHMYAYLLYSYPHWLWSIKDDSTLDLKEITNFMAAIAKTTR